MNSQTPIGFGNTGAPLAILLLGALIVPRLFVDRNTISHRRVFISVTISSVFLLFMGAVIFGVVYHFQGAKVFDAFAVNLWGTTLFFLTLSIKAAIFWVPVMLLVWFGLAQRVERNRGDKIARQDKI